MRILEEFEDIVNDYGQEYFQATEIKFSPDLSLYRPKGCAECSGTGYRGRVGIHELMEGTAKIKKMVKKQAYTEDSLPRVLMMV